MEHPLITNSRDADKHSGFMLPVDPATFETKGVCEALVERILESYPHYFDDVNYLMTSPTDLIKGTPVTAMSNPLKTKYDLSTFADVQISDKDNKIEYILVSLAEAIGEELVELQAALHEKRQTMCLYQLTAYKGADHSTFEPNINFGIRYGIYQKL